MSQHRHGSVRFNDIDGNAGAAPDAEFCRIDNVDLNAEPQRTSKYCAGETVPDMIVIDKIDPVLRGTVFDHAQVVLLNSAECGVKVLDIEAYLRAVDADTRKPIAKATASHAYFEIAEGLVYWTEMTLEAGQDSQINIVCDVTFDPDGVPTTPFVLTESIAYPTISGGHDLFTLGKMFLNGVQVDTVQRITVTNEYQFDDEVEAARRTDYREARVISTGQTKIRVRLKERTNWKSIAHSGTDLDGTNGIVFYARKKGYAETASQHVKWQAIDGTAYPINFEGSGQNLATDEFVIDVSKVTTHLVGTALQAIP